MSDENRLEAVVKPKPAEITGFRLDIGINATVTVRSKNGDHWIKPITTAGLEWDGIPTEEEIRKATKLLLRGVVEPVTSEVVSLIYKKIV